MARLLDGKVVRGTVLSRSELQFGSYVVAITATGSPRLPNGIECSVTAPARARVAIGGGKVRIGRLEIAPGAPWNPVPVFTPIDCLPAGPLPTAPRFDRDVGAMGSAEGAVLSGYVAGLVLLHGHKIAAEQVAARAIPRLDPAAATLMRHAAVGEVPEPVHELLVSGQAGRLISSSPLGIAWLRGFVSAGLPLDSVGVRVADGRRTA